MSEVRIHVSTWSSLAPTSRKLGSRSASTHSRRRDREAAEETQVIAARVDPLTQPVPLGEKSLMSDLDRGAPRLGVSVERDESGATESVEHFLNCGGIVSDCG